MSEPDVLVELGEATAREVEADLALSELHMKLMAADLDNYTYALLSRSCRYAYACGRADAAAEFSELLDAVGAAAKEVERVAVAT